MPFVRNFCFTDVMFNTVGLLVFSVVSTMFLPHDASKTRLETFKSMGVRINTDKVTHHKYDRLYDKYLGGHRLENLKLLEIGLGCGNTLVP